MFRFRGVEEAVELIIGDEVVGQWSILSAKLLVRSLGLLRMPGDIQLLVVGGALERA